ncbi:hypothetical protein F5146DRAFT_1001307 [Armillaria mellea]|nr:hypothetical protein F5146DRAFT_1001307 [Armillaria mellea]
MLRTSNLVDLHPPTLSASQLPSQSGTAYKPRVITIPVATARYFTPKHHPNTLAYPQDIVVFKRLRALRPKCCSHAYRRRGALTKRIALDGQERWRPGLTDDEAFVTGGLINFKLGWQSNRLRRTSQRGQGSDAVDRFELCEGDVLKMELSGHEVEYLEMKGEVFHGQILGGRVIGSRDPGEKSQLLANSNSCKRDSMIRMEKSSRVKKSSSGCRSPIRSSVDDYDTLLYGLRCGLCWPWYIGVMYE